MKIIALIPARKGSIRLPDKNLAKIGDKTLIEYAIEQAKGATSIDQIIVLSADERVKQIALNQKDVIFEQEPEYLCGEYVQPAQYISYIQMRYSYDILVLLQPTSPTRSSDDIDWCIDVLIKTGVDSVVTFNRKVVHHLVPNGGIYVMRRGKAEYNDWMIGVTVSSVDIDTVDDLRDAEMILR